MTSTTISFARRDAMFLFRAHIWWHLFTFSLLSYFTFLLPCPLLFPLLHILFLTSSYPLSFPPLPTLSTDHPLHLPLYLSTSFPVSLVSIPISAYFQQYDIQRQCWFGVFEMECWVAPFISPEKRRKNKIRGRKVLKPSFVIFSLKICVNLMVFPFIWRRNSVFSSAVNRMLHTA